MLFSRYEMDLNRYETVQKLIPWIHIVSIGFAWRSELFPVCRSKHRFVKAFLIGYSAWRFEGGVSNMHADWVISMSACRPTTSFPTSDLREHEHFCLISFEKCGESGYFIHGEVQDEVVNVLFTSNFRRQQSTASAASWLTVTVEVGRDMRVRI